jgi:hypothetical protein
MLYRYLRSKANREVRRRSESGVITPSTGYDHADGARVRPACSSSPLTCSSPSFPSLLPASCLRRTHLCVSSRHRHRSRPCLRSRNRLSSPLARTAPVFIFLTLAVRLRPRLCSRSHLVVSPAQCLTSHCCHLLPSRMLAVLTPHACTCSCTHLSTSISSPRSLLASSIPAGDSLFLLCVHAILCTCTCTPSSCFHSHSHAI